MQLISTITCILLLVCSIASMQKKVFDQFECFINPALATSVDRWNKTVHAYVVEHIIMSHSPQRQQLQVYIMMLVIFDYWLRPIYF